MPLATSEYIEVNLIGVVLLYMMLFFLRKRHEKEESAEQMYFVRMLHLNAWILLTDLGICLLRGHGGLALIVLNHAVCMAYFIMHFWFCLEWVYYVIAKLYPRVQISRTVRILLMAPTFAGCVITALSPVTGWVYTLTEENVYRRGPLLWIVFVAAILYHTVSMGLILHEKRHPSRSRENGEYWALMGFPILIFAGNVLQLLFYGLSVVWISTALCMLILFVSMQNEQMSCDKLTGLYNRGQINAQLVWEIGRLHGSGDYLFAAMLDLDHFKQMNDRFGHLTGDKALKVAAGILKNNTRKSDFVGRFGGDEFLLIGHVKNPENVEEILKRITDAIEQTNTQNLLPCRLSVSIGCTVVRAEDQPTMDSLINDADSRMYEEKRRKECYEGKEQL